MLKSSKTRENLPCGLHPSGAARAVEWRHSAGLIGYHRAVAVMEQRAAAIAAGNARELVWLIEHPAIYTAGTSANPDDLLNPLLPVYASARGGQFTYHGPGQRVVYLMLDLGRRVPDVRRLVATLETWLIRTLQNFGVRGERREDRIGVWVPSTGPQPAREDKIAAIGIRVRRFVTMHGISLNVAPELAHFAGIVPCGIASPRYGVTSLAQLGKHLSMAEVDAALRREFEPLFGAAESLPGDPEELRQAPARASTR